MIRKTVAVVLMGTIAWTSTWAAAPAFAQGQVSTDLDYDRAMQRLDSFMALLEELRLLVDRSQFDLEALLDKLDYDAESVIRFVKEEIAFEPYPGLLRGGEGTLMSRAGNSLDQAILLATLLRDSGLDARLVQGRLSNERSLQLLQEMARENRSRAPLGDLEKMRPHLRELVVRLGLPAEGTEELLDQLLSEVSFEESGPWSDTLNDAEFLRAQLEANSQRLEPQSITRELMEETRDYFWVEYREGAVDPWQGVHPAFSDPLEGLSLPEVETTFTGSIPGHLLHRIRIEVQIDRTVGDKQESIPVMEPWERPVANLIGTSLSFGNLPSGASDINQVSNLQAVATSTDFFLPTLNGSVANGAMAFDLDGVTIAAEDLAAGGAAAGFFKQIGSNVESAANALSGLGAGGSTDEAKDLRTLDRQWIRYTLAEPGGGSRSWTRTIFERSANNGDESTDFAQLVAHHGIATQSGPLAAAFLLDRQIRDLVAKRDFLEWSLARRYNRTQADPTPEMLASLVDHPEHRYFDVFDAFPGTPSNERVFRGEPSLLVIRQGPVLRGSKVAAFVELDLVNNRHQAIRIEKGEFFSAPQTALLRGVWETRMEQVGMALDQEEVVRRLTTREVFDRARLENIDIVALDPSSSKDLARFDISSRTSEALQRDLDEGYWILLPDRMPGDGSAGWWRVHPETGETLGRGADGRGISSTEYVTALTVASVFVAVLFGSASFANCMQNSPCEWDQCLVTAGIGALLGFAFSYAIGWILVAALPAELAIGGIVLTQAETAGTIAALVFAGDFVIGGGSLPVLPACLQ